MFPLHGWTFPPLSTGQFGSPSKSIQKFAPNTFMPLSEVKRSKIIALRFTNKWSIHRNLQHPQVLVQCCLVRHRSEQANKRRQGQATVGSTHESATSQAESDHSHRRDQPDQAKQGHFCPSEQQLSDPQ